MVPDSMIPGIYLLVVLCWFKPLRMGTHLWVRNREGKQLLLVGRTAEQKSVILFLELIGNIKILHFVYTICILSRLHFSFPVFVLFSRPLWISPSLGNSVFSKRERGQDLDVNQFLLSAFLKNWHLCWKRDQEISKLQAFTVALWIIRSFAGGFGCCNMEIFNVYPLRIRLPKAFL